MPLVRQTPARLMFLTTILQRTTETHSPSTAAPTHSTPTNDKHRHRHGRPADPLHRYRRVDQHALPSAGTRGIGPVRTPRPSRRRVTAPDHPGVDDDTTDEQATSHFDPSPTMATSPMEEPPIHRNSQQRIIFSRGGRETERRCRNHRTKLRGKASLQRKSSERGREPSRPLTLLLLLPVVNKLHYYYYDVKERGCCSQLTTAVSRGGAA